MTDINSIVKFLNKTLRVRSIKDSSRNGLQVRCNKRIRKIGFAVDASLSTFKKAKAANVDLIIVHHGILWKGFRDKTGLIKRWIMFLQKNKISLYACHLPLDMHEKYGNNIQLAQLLDLAKIKKFGRYHGKSIGYQGELQTPLTIDALAKKINRKIKSKCINLAFGKRKIKMIGIVSGGGSSAFTEAFQKNLDCFITGEASHMLYHAAKDLHQNVILAGHYETETVGVKALIPLIESHFGISTLFIDNPTDGI
ncbi:MAG: Nif3-like dinuclear metal center hexameric protein [Pseudomonadota bacterium]